MENIVKKKVTYLTTENANVLTQKYVTVGDEEIQVGSNYRCGYTNDLAGRKLLLENEPEDVVSEVLEVWGDAPTVETQDFSNCKPEPTTEERLEILEAENERLTNENLDSIEIEAELLYELSMLQLGI